MSSAGPLERTLIMASIVNGGLGLAIGSLAAGVSGAKIGLVAGLALAALPIAVRAVSAWVIRPDGLPRFVLAEVGAAAVTTSQAIVDGVASLVRPVVAQMQAPTLLACFAADVFANALAGMLGGLWCIVATPLGVANVAALAVIFAILAGLDFATPVAFLALGMLMLVLLVTESEARDEADHG